MKLADVTFSRIALKCKGTLVVIVYSGDRLSSTPVVSFLPQVLVFSTVFKTISGYGPSGCQKSPVSHVRLTVWGDLFLSPPSLLPPFLCVRLGNVKL